MSNASNTEKQQKLVKARKACRVAFAMFLFGGGILVAYGFYNSFLPTVLDGVVLGVGSLLPLVVSKKIEKKLDHSMV